MLKETLQDDYLKTDVFPNFYFIVTYFRVVHYVAVFLISQQKTHVVILVLPTQSNVRDHLLALWVLMHKLHKDWCGGN